MCTHVNGVDPEEYCKYKIRLGHLKQTFQREKEHYDSHMVDISLSIHRILNFAVDVLFPSLDLDFSVDLTNYADYQTSVAFKILKKLKSQGFTACTKKIAQEVISKLPPNDVIDQAWLSGNGFINISVREDFLVAEVNRVVGRGVRPPVLRTETLTGPILIDMSSPNIAKEMHVGHLRSTILGESFSRLFEFAWKREIIKISHIGDWGTQFGMLIAHLEDNFPNFRTETPSIGNLQMFYKEAKSRFTTDEVFKKRGYNAVVKLQAYDPDNILAWKAICEASFREFSKIYERLKIANLINRGESYYNDMMAATVAELEEQGLVRVEEGRKLIFDCGSSYPLTVVKSDGGFTYDTSDLAAIRHRLVDVKVASIYYVVDAGQSEHLESIYAVARMVGWLTQRNDVAHLKFGVVQGEDKKRLKTRSGHSIRLVDLLDEGIRRAREKLLAMERDKVLTGEQFDLAEKAVAYGCIKYSDLMHNRLHDYVFSFDRMLEDRGNTAVYLLYSYVRMMSILRQVENYQASECSRLSHPAERKLCLTLLQFSTVINRSLEEMAIHVLCEYAYLLCSMFSDFYEKCHCVDNTESGKVVDWSRIALVVAASRVLGTLMDILGIDRIEYI